MSHAITESDVEEAALEILEGLGYKTVYGPGIHGTFPCRAIDWSVKGFDNPKGIEQDINQNWIYDPARPKMKCAVLHDVGHGMHLHTQVHEKTTYLEGGAG